MTAPAEHPRSGETTLPCPRDGDPCAATCGSRRTCAFIRAANRPPAAGRGDTDSGGHRQAASDYAAIMRARADLAAAARPAGDRAQPTQELREAIAEASHIGRAAAIARGVTGDWNIHLAVADAVLALPAVAALLDAQAAVSRVEAAINRHADNLTPTQRAAFARALTGTTT